MGQKVYVKNIAELLRERFDEAKERNPSYSMRAFARDCGCSPAMISLILNGKKQPSIEVRRTVLTNLEVDEQEIERYCTTPADEGAFVERPMEEIEEAGDFFSFMVLEAISLAGHLGVNPTREWIIQKLDLDAEFIEGAIEKMLALDRVVETSNGLVLSGVSIEEEKDCSTVDTEEIPPELRRKMVNQVLTQTRHCFDHREPELQYQDGFSCVLDSKIIPELQKRMKETLYSLMVEYSHKSTDYDMVALGSINMVPLTFLDDQP